MFLTEKRLITAVFLINCFKSCDPSIWWQSEKTLNICEFGRGLPFTFSLILHVFKAFSLGVQVPRFVKSRWMFLTEKRLITSVFLIVFCRSFHQTIWWESEKTLNICDFGKGSPFSFWLILHVFKAIFPVETPKLVEKPLDVFDWKTTHHLCFFDYLLQSIRLVVRSLGCFSLKNGRTLLTLWLFENKF